MTAAHKCFNELIKAVIQHRKRKGSIEFVAEDKDVSFKKIRGKSALRHLCTAEQVEQVAKQSYYELEHNQELRSWLDRLHFKTEPGFYHKWRATRAVQ